MTTQAMGPHVLAKEAMNMHAATIMTMPTVSLPSGFFAVPMEAKMHIQAACQSAPMKRGQRRPNFSTTYRPKKVMTTLTAPRMSWVRMGSSTPALVKTVAP